MNKAERKAMRMLGIKESKSSGQVATFSLKNTILGKTWYLDSVFEKLIFVAGFFALLWTIGTLLIFGAPWN